MDMSLLLDTLEQFHFIRPEWLFALPLACLLWLLLRNQAGDQQWAGHIPKEMLAALQVSSAKQSNWWKWCLLVLLLGVITAAAGPTWDKQALPAVQNQKALVLVLDLSPSMLAQDLAPDRVTRAKFKLIDVLREQTDGQAALIAYAGDAHTVSPLTNDPQTIEALLPALHPNVMPSQGSNTEAAIDLAQQLLSDAGLSSGDILLISDGVADEAITSISRSISSSYRLSVLAVGSNDAAPIPSANGGFVRRANGEIVLSKVNASELRSMASSLGGRFSLLTTDDTDIKTLLIADVESDQLNANNDGETHQSDVVYDAWVDMGHYLVLIMLPLALFLFRKGTIYLIPLFLPLLFLTPNNTYAAELSWKDLWQTQDQQAAKQYESGDFDAAANRFKRNDWSAVANYRNGSYDKVIEQLEGLNDVTSLYNKANALALNGQLEKALEAYEQVLEQQADNQDAAHNKSIIEQLLQQQDQDQQQNQDSEDSSDGDSSEQQDQEQQDQEQQDQDSQSSDESQEQQDSQQQSSEESSQAEDEQSQEGSSEQAEDSAEQDENGSEQTEDGEAGQEDTTEDQETAEKDPQASDEEEGEESDQSLTAGQADNTDEPLKDSSEQWLRTIQDDPSGLLRRKFDYQAQKRARQNNRRTNNNAAQQRY